MSPHTVHCSEKSLPCRSVYLSGRLTYMQLGQICVYLALTTPGLCNMVFCVLVWPVLIADPGGKQLQSHSPSMLGSALRKQHWVIQDLLPEAPVPCAGCMPARHCSETCVITCCMHSNSGWLETRVCHAQMYSWLRPVSSHAASSTGQAGWRHGYAMLKTYSLQRLLGQRLKFVCRATLRTGKDRKPQRGTTSFKVTIDINMTTVHNLLGKRTLRGSSSLSQLTCNCHKIIAYDINSA